MLTARLCGKPVVLVLSGFPAKVSSEERTTLFRTVDRLVQFGYICSSRIIAYSDRIVTERHLERYRNKILMAQEHFLDFSQFQARTRFNQRGNLVAYIGRLTEGKGVPQFLEAIELLTERDASFLIGGDGPLRPWLEEYLEKRHLHNRVRYVGWIPHDSLAEYLNQAKLLVLPTFAEGLPNIMLESMACGTPVLATAVGAIPDVIKDGNNRFIMEDNYP